LRKASVDGVLVAATGAGAGNDVLGDGWADVE
jgi:methanogenic corrinoid protein MtbC1